MYANELVRAGRKIPGFIGVYPLDKIPQHLEVPSCFIINTDTHNLKGRHWLAVSYENGGIAYAFDPLGVYYPQILVDHLHRLPFHKIIYNNKMYQMPWEKTCGRYCLSFLRARANAYKHLDM